LEEHERRTGPKPGRDVDGPLFSSSCPRTAAPETAWDIDTVKSLRRAFLGVEDLAFETDGRTDERAGSQ
jgi:hypothetical protein